MKKSVFVIVGLVIMIGVLAAGAYTGVRLLAAPDAEMTVAGGGRTFESVKVVNGGAPISVRTTILPAPELPDEPSAAFGIFVRRQDDNIVIGTGNIDLEVDVEVDGNSGQQETSVIPRTDGPEVEVVITRDTIIYEDVTDFTGSPPAESGEQEIQQRVKRVDTAEDIGDNNEIEVWGQRRGDRIIATVIVFGPLAGGQFE